MSRIIDVVNKIMQISGEIKAFIEVSKGKKWFIFEIYNW